MNDLKHYNKIERKFIPEIDDKIRYELYNGWIDAIKSSINL